MIIDLSGFRDVYLQECAEHLAAMESDLLRIESSPAEPELLNSIFRAAHSIKGGAGTFGFNEVAHFTHTLESLLDRMRGGEIAPSPELTRLLLRSVDTVKELLASTEDRASAELLAGSEAVRIELEAELGRVREAEPVAVADLPQAPGQSVKSETVYHIHFAPAPHIFSRGTNPLLLLRNLQDVGEVVDINADTSHIPTLAALDPTLCYLSWVAKLRTDRPVAEIEEVFAFVEDDAEILIEAAEPPETTPAEGLPVASVSVAASAAPEAPFVERRRRERDTPNRTAIRDGASIRVPAEKVDKLIDLVGELVIAQSMTTEIADHFTAASLPRLREAVATMERNTRELQERIMAVRMLPVGTVFNRFPRLVHDIAESTGKKIALRMSGEETELDKGVLERMSDPLTHLIRNAADHGLEDPETRTRCGKPEEGVITLRAFHQGGSIVVEVSDDGRGLNTSRIREKAIECGVIAGDASLSDEQVQRLIFEPGFSTCDQVSDLSGRGVGMDVVKRNVESLNGVVSILSEPGAGTTVRIRLPLTLAILDGLLVRVGAQTYVIPLTSIVESVRPLRAQVSNIAGRGEVVVVRDEPLRLVRLHRLFDIPEAVTDPTLGLVVIAEHGAAKLALLVDELLGQQQVVVKSLETHFRRVDGALGATILGNGRAALILDVSGLLQSTVSVAEDAVAA
jgi:two-component system chemotaxis sensor kinase CheA